MKMLYWLGTSQKDIRAFPDDVKHEAGVDLMRVQYGLEPRDWKPIPTVGAGVREVRVRSKSGAFRIFYVLENGDAIFVLHAFQKKTQKTEKHDIDKGKARYKLIK
jgi:phage-related protein